MSLADLYSALADPTRLRVLEMLHDNPRPVHELAGAFDISRPAISRHLRVLKQAGLVKEVKQGRENLYSFQRDELKTGIAWLEQHQRRPNAKAKAKAKTQAVQVAAPLVAEAPVVEPVIAPAPVIEAVVVAKAEVAAKASAPAKPRAAKAEPQPITPPPPKQAPQLSFFDL